MDFHAKLKAATRSAHDAIDRELDLVGTALTATRYRSLIVRFYGFYLPLETVLFSAQAWPATGIDPELRRKAPMLLTDLQALDIDFAEAALCEEMPDMETAARRLGCLYVVEGSTLGGQIIGRHLRQNLGITPQSGGRFFAGYAENTGRMWQAFLTQLEAQANSATEQDDIVRGALSTYETLTRWCQH